MPSGSSAACRRHPASTRRWMYKLLGKLPRKTGSPRRIRPVADWRPVLPRLQLARRDSNHRQVARLPARIRVMKTSIRFFEIFFALLCLALLPNAQAVNPPPDGGYPGFNTAEGQNALLNLDVSGGLGNTAVGWFALSSNIDNDFSTAVGAGALLFNRESSNTAVGAAALLFNDQGSDNTAVGVSALLNNVDGFEHTACGSGALLNSTGVQNTAFGADALGSTTTGGTNVAVGRGALGLNTTGSSNIALGFNAGIGVTTGSNVISIGIPSSRRTWTTAALSATFLGSQPSTSARQSWSTPRGSSARSARRAGSSMRLNRWTKSAKPSLRSSP